MTAAGTGTDQIAYTVIQQDDDKEQPTVQELKNQLENGRDDQKIETMKKILIIMLNGDPLQQCLMHVIRFVMPSKNKQLKKLLLIYWEICPKHNPDGKLKQEMVLFCNALRNDLLHPNEYIRGMTLRFLCKLREAELLEPLIPSVRQCLEHRHFYVRKNALLAVYSIYKAHDFLIPDAPELAEKCLATEGDMNCKRNAFMLLMNTKQQLAVQYLSSVFSQITTFDELMQLALIELIRKEAKANTADKGKFIQCIFSLLHASAPAVKYEAATTLVALTSHTSAVKAAATAYIELIVKESDNNVKLIVLDRLKELREKHERILDELVMDIMRVLTSSDIEVRRKCLNIAMEMVSSRNVDEVVGFLKKELLKTHDQDFEKNSEYRQLLIQSIHQCAIKFSEVAGSVVHALMEFLSDSTNPSAVVVIAFAREVMEKFPQLRGEVISKLLELFAELKTGRVLRGALWIIGEYFLDQRSIEEAMRQIRMGLGELPILTSEQRALEEQNTQADDLKQPETQTPQPQKQAKRILADGTYATESALSVRSGSQSKSEALKAEAKPLLRASILNGDWFIASVLTITLAKLTLRYASICKSEEKVNAYRCEAMLIMTSIIRVGRSELPSFPIDEDSIDRIMVCLRLLSSVTEEDSQVKRAFLIDARKAFTQMVKAEEKRVAAKSKSVKKMVPVHVDDAIIFRQLKSKRALGDTNDEYELDVTRATGISERSDNSMSKLSHVVQLTGFSDPVYAEAYVNVHQYDVLLDVLIVNQTENTLQNLTLELSTFGDLKVVERPSPHTLGPRGFHSIKANIKVSSTETGIIFGNIVYDGSSSQDTNCVVLNNIHIDIVDYISPATCEEAQFRSMWTEFEWENKVGVDTNIRDLRQYMTHIMKCTNMGCITPEQALSGDCKFLAANLYARSIFGEDALANVCLDKEGERITGHIRIRSKTQGIALSLGDKITLSQKLIIPAAA